jgi:rubrerythrin
MGLLKTKAFNMKTVIKISLIVIAVVYLSGCSTKPVKTIENLKTAFNGESTASAKYAAFAEKAKSEGFDTVAIMLTAISKSEAIHASNHLKVIEKLVDTVVVPVIGKFEVLSTKENVADAMKGESYEAETMYPEFVKIAEKEKCIDGKQSFAWALNAEKKHFDFFKSSLESLNDGSEINLPTGWFICPLCGNTYNNTAVTAVCDVCGTTPDKFIVFN